MGVEKCENCKFGYIYEGARDTGWFASPKWVIQVRCCRFPKSQTKEPDDWCGEYGISLLSDVGRS